MKSLKNSFVEELHNIKQWNDLKKSVVLLLLLLILLSMMLFYGDDNDEQKEDVIIIFHVFPLSKCHLLYRCSHYCCPDSLKTRMRI